MVALELRGADKTAVVDFLRTDPGMLGEVLNRLVREDCLSADHSAAFLDRSVGWHARVTWPCRGRVMAVPWPCGGCPVTVPWLYVGCAVAVPRPSRDCAVLRRGRAATALRHVPSFYRVPCCVRRTWPLAWSLRRSVSFTRPNSIIHPSVATSCFLLYFFAFRPSSSIAAQQIVGHSPQREARQGWQHPRLAGNRVHGAPEKASQGSRGSQGKRKRTCSPSRP